MVQFQDLWNSAIQRMKGVLREQLTYCRDREICRELKQTAYLFGKTMAKHLRDLGGFEVLLDLIRDKYTDLSVGACVNALKQVGFSSYESPHTEQDTQNKTN